METNPSSEMARGPLVRRLSGFYAAYFLAIGIYAPYWQLWLDGKGLSPVEIGWVLASAFWIKILAQPVVARIVDWKGRTRWLTTGLMAGAAVLFAVQSSVSGFWPLLILGGLTAACYQPVLPVMESVVLRHVNANDLDYGRIRLWGSITFIAGTVCVGLWVERASADLVVWLMVAGMVVVAMSCAMAPERPPRTERRHATSLSREFLKPSFLLFLLTAGLINASQAMLNGFASLHWRAQGHGETTIGLFWATGVVAEIILFFLAGRFRDKLGPLTLLMLSALGGVIRWPLLAFVDDAGVLYAVQTLHALTFGAGHLGAMLFLARAVPPDLSATGQSLYYALVGGVLTGLMLPMAGSLYTGLGGDTYLVMGVLSLAGFIGVIILRRIWRNTG